MNTKMNTKLNTPTPRTDADVFYPDDSKEKAVDSFFAQQLERELATLTAERDQLRALLVYTDQLHDEALDAIISERDPLRAELTTERARMKKIEIALKDAISTYFGADKLVTAERIEAWQFAMKEDAK